MMDTSSEPHTTPKPAQGVAIRLTGGDSGCLATRSAHRRRGTLMPSAAGSYPKRRQFGPATSLFCFAGDTGATEGLAGGRPGAIAVSGL
jgi:hypothetical protein